MQVFKALVFIIIVTIYSAKGNPSEKGGPSVRGLQLIPRKVPLFIGKGEIALYDLKIDFHQERSPDLRLQEIQIRFGSGSQTDCIASVSIFGKDLHSPLFGSVQQIDAVTKIAGNTLLMNGNNLFTINFASKSNAALNQRFDIQQIDLTFNDSKTLTVVPESEFSNRPTLVLRAAGQDQIDTYRIPGLATTKKGTLIAVYDNRYSGSGDLQGDIDVGMSRSTDGGQTWEAMKTVIDMGTYNNLPQSQNGVGDPSVLVDQVTGTIWVAALWVNGIPGESAWNGSRPGLKPGITGQFILVKSEDDGVTWSQPINITEQCKNPEWNLFFQGPGKGITTTDGTLVFPAQYKDEQQVPFSTIIFSKDHGRTWRAGTGAKPNTTESQVVELSDGTLMLNMRDDLNRKEKGEKNGRAVSVTRDLGRTWTTHSSSNSALQEPNCMASIISARVRVNGSLKDVLFFSNPNDKSVRNHLTIKASPDQGATWPVAYQKELSSSEGYGYSCLTMVNDTTLGILFEGVKDLYFQEISVDEILYRHK